MSDGFTSRLSQQQYLVASHVEGPLLVVAGPGSGKTRVLTERVRNLLTTQPGHFRVLALTFTNRAADEMKERLSGLGAVRDRAFIGTLHGFCLEILTERGKLIGIEGPPNIFEQPGDRREVLERAVAEDPYLSDQLNEVRELKERHRRISAWLARISHVKSHPITCALVDDDETAHLLDAYEAGMRASNAYDFDDLLLLSFKLFTDYPKVAEIYRKIYKYICIDESQDMNEAQFALIKALCADIHRNVMLVGDPRQSIYGFNTSGPEYMEQLGKDFNAKRIELNANFRSSRAVVDYARSLDPNYLVDQQLPIRGAVTVLRGADEKDEASKVVCEIEKLLRDGHPDIEGKIVPNRCAVLGRTRFALLAIETKLREKNIAFAKRMSAGRENESPEIEDFFVALRIFANPQDQLHLSVLAKRWKIDSTHSFNDFPSTLSAMAVKASTRRAEAVYNAVMAISKRNDKLDLMPAFELLKRYADTLDEREKLPIYEDVTVLSGEWDQFLRTATGVRNITAFLSNKALGSTQWASRDGVALMTVHASKGLEFDVVFIAGMAQGVFPDYRATTPKEREEEGRNAFVAATRARRLLYLSYPASRVMPWGDTRSQTPSQFIAGAQ